MMVITNSQFRPAKQCIIRISCSYLVSSISRHFEFDYIELSRLLVKVAFNSVGLFNWRQYVWQLRVFTYDLPLV